MDVLFFSHVRSVETERRRTPVHQFLMGPDNVERELVESRADA